MNTQPPPALFAGIDWGSQLHQVCLRASDGAVLGEKAFAHSGQELSLMLDWMLALTDAAPAQIVVAIEIPHGPVVDSLLDRGFRVFSINPKQLDRFRDRFSPAGAKDDRRDARVLADALRTDPDCLRELDPLDGAVMELREWSRMSDELTTERTRLTNQVRAQLWRYFPQVLELGFALHSPVIRALWTRIPTPARAHRVRQASVEKILKKHRIRRIDAAEALQILRAKPITVADGVVNAATARIRLILEQLALLEKQIREADQAIDDLLATRNVKQTDPDPDASETGGNTSGSEPSSDKAALRDVEILSSLPGVGNKVLATLISEASALLNDRDYQALRCLCGVAPVTRRSGKSWRVVRRRASQGRLVNALYHWGRVAVQHDPISKAKYKALRARGHSHGRALRSVTDRLLAIACAMLRNRSCFDPSRPTAAVQPTHS